MLHHLANPWALSLLWLLPGLWLLAALARRRRRRRLARIGTRAALKALTTVRRWRRFLRATCFQLGLIVLVVAIAGPQWGYDPAPALASGRDLVVVLDLSRSMQAEDVLPSRLGRAKQALVELADTVQRRGGHRLALVAFAGQARIVCPLTPDYDHFRFALGRLEAGDPLLAPPATEQEPTSGTRLGLGIRLAVELHDRRFPEHQDILVLSDGDDPARDDEWRVGVADARTRGIPVHTVGIGNPDSASPIPDKEGKPLRHAGKEIRSRLEETPLESIARLTGGVYIPARLNPPPLTDWFRVFVHDRPARDLSEDLLSTQRPRYPWFLAASLALFALATGIGDLPRSASPGRAGRDNA